MSNINKQALREAAEKAKDNFMPNFMAPTRDVLSLLYELEAAEKRIAELTEFLTHIKKCLVRNGEYAPLSHEEIDTLLGIRAAGIITKVGE